MQAVGSTSLSLKNEEKEKLIFKWKSHIQAVDTCNRWQQYLKDWSFYWMCFSPPRTNRINIRFQTIPTVHIHLVICVHSFNNKAKLLLKYFHIPWNLYLLSVSTKSFSISEADRGSLWPAPAVCSRRAKGGGHVSAVMEEEKMAASVLSTYYVLNLDSFCRSCRPIILCH